MQVCVGWRVCLCVGRGGMPLCVPVCRCLYYVCMFVSVCVHTHAPALVRAHV